jgi:peroxiredoxin
MTSARESELRAQAEEEWLDRWTTGPTEGESDALATGSPAPDLSLLDHTGRQRRLSDFWSGQPALLMFWRHFGCPCGFDRAERLHSEVEGYLAAGLQPVIIGQGEPERADAYRAEHEIPCTILCDPDHDAYRAYGIGHWNIERVLPDAAPEYWTHTQEVGKDFQTAFRAQGHALVDDPWRAVREVVVGANGRIRLAYTYQYCSDFPDPQLLTTAALLS